MKARNLISGTIGNAFEWYDFSVYGVLAPLMAALFFPGHETQVGLVYVWLIFAIGLLVRPIGGLFFGYIGDKLGRRKALLISIVLMSASTTLLGLLPTKESVGIFAPLLLLLVRLLQGLSVGGELIGTMIYLVEFSPLERRGFFGSLVYSLGTAGVLLGFVVVTLFSLGLSSGQMMAWGWRLPFLCGIVLLPIGLIIRFFCEETTQFLALKEAKQIAKAPIRETIQSQPRSVLTVWGLTCLQTVPFYVVYIFLPQYLMRYFGLTRTEVLKWDMVILLVFSFTVPLSGWLYDRFGASLPLFSGACSLLLFPIPIFLFFLYDWHLIYPMLILLSLLVALYQGPLSATFVNLFPPQHRYSGIGLGYNLSASMFGGTAPLLISLLIKATDFPLIPAIYLSMSAMFSLVFLFFSLPWVSKKFYY